MLKDMYHVGIIAKGDAVPGGSLLIDVEVKEKSVFFKGIEVYRLKDGMDPDDYEFYMSGII